mmetsp:Transcript_13436/g.19371  ORF Transcript_13436/g.19371 Transcript_13436/m.19371 type:complete len:178 (+) Transcript_13436:1148-1681(+)
MWLSRVDEDVSSVVRLCGRHQKEEGRADGDEVGREWWKRFVQKRYGQMAVGRRQGGFASRRIVCTRPEGGGDADQIGGVWGDVSFGGVGRDGQMVVAPLFLPAPDGQPPPVLCRMKEGRYAESMASLLCAAGRSYRFQLFILKASGHLDKSELECVRRCLTDDSAEYLGLLRYFRVT